MVSLVIRKHDDQNIAQIYLSLLGILSKPQIVAKKAIPCSLRSKNHTKAQPYTICSLVRFLLLLFCEKNGNEMLLRGLPIHVPSFMYGVMAEKFRFTHI